MTLSLPVCTATSSSTGERLDGYAEPDVAAFLARC